MTIRFIRSALRFLHSVTAKRGIVLKTSETIIRRSLKRRHRRDVMFRDRGAERDDRSVIASPSASFESTAVGLVCHSGRAIQ
jgi:hypothetical protein